MQGGIELPDAFSGQGERVVLLPSGIVNVFHRDLIFVLISWGDNRPLGEWKFSCPSWLCPSHPELPPNRVRQDFSSRTGTVVALSFEYWSPDGEVVVEPEVLGVQTGLAHFLVFLLPNRYNRAEI